MKEKLFGCMTALVALLTASCSSDSGLTAVPGNGADGEEVEVTFSLAPENAALQSRSGKTPGGPGVHQASIGKGENVDMLIYAVYDEEYTPLTQYGIGVISDDPEFENHAALTMTDETTGEVFRHEGQTIVDVSNVFPDGAYTFTLRLMRNKVYHIAFWAQSSQSAAFNTDNLENVEVIYENALNNDELRDAFCKVESFSVNPSETSRTVYLTRPMAQINVGTTGADYKNIICGEKVFPNKKITHSQITVTGVATTIDVVRDVIGDALATPVTFGWQPIAAFYKTGIPASVDSLLESYNEEFLLVDLNQDGSIQEYKTEYPTVDKDGNILTETFKYLSMCYALVPAATNKGGGDPYYSTILNKVEVSFAEKDKLAEAYTYMTLYNVHAQRNWRTNILGGLHTTGDPDPSSLFSLTTALVGVDHLFNGEYTTQSGGYEWTQNTFPGVFDDDDDDDDSDSDDDGDEEKN